MVFLHAKASILKTNNYKRGNLNMGKSKIHNLPFYLLLWIVCFVFLFIFFSQVHQIGIFDADDWTYISYARDALPNAKAWNPTRVFPEIFMPAVGALAAFVITPLTGDYLNAMTLTYAFTFSAFISFYVLSFAWMIKHSFCIGKWSTTMLTLLFVTAHFWIFRSNYDNNSYLFLSRNLTCIFYYTIPTLLNAMLVILFEAKPNIWNTASLGTKGILLFTIYLAIYSNLFSSIVLVAYCGVIILHRVLLAAIQKKSIVCFWARIKQNFIHIGIIVAWLVSLIFEIKGGRADSIGTFGGIAELKSAAHNLTASFKSINPIFGLFAIITIGIALGIIIYEIVHKKATDETFRFIAIEFHFLLAAAITALYQVLLCGVTSLSGYLACSEVQISIYFFLLMALFFSVCYTVRRLPTCSAFLPMLLCIAIFNCNTQGKTYRDSFMSNVSAKTSQAITQDIYQQVLNADNGRTEEMNLYVPSFQSTTDNWPMAVYLGERVSRTLYKHGQISTPIQITIVPDPERNKLYGIN